jgi:hypothetical protein
MKWNNYRRTVVEVFVVLKSAPVCGTSVSSIGITIIGIVPAVVVWVFDCLTLDGSVGSLC